MVPEDVSHLCLPDLPHKVTLITKLTSPLNSHQKMVPKDDEDSTGTPQGLHKDSMDSLGRVLMDSMGTPWGLHRDFTGTP